MGRRAPRVFLVAALVVAVAAAGATSARTGGPVKLTVWLPFAARELDVVKKTLAEYDAKHPEVQVEVAGGVATAKIVAAIRSGNAPDVAMDFESATVGTYCPSGAFIDLGPYLKRDHVDPAIFTPASRYYTQYKGI